MGIPSGKPATSGLTKAVAWFFALVGVVMVVAAISGQKDTKERAQAAVAEQARDEAAYAAMSPEKRAVVDAARAREAEIEAEREQAWSAVAACERALRASLHDPGSAKMEPATGWFREKTGSGYAVQPRGRAKNQLGAYVLGVWDCDVSIDGGRAQVTRLEQIRP